MRNKKKYIIGIGILLALIAVYFVMDSLLFDGFRPRKINQDGFQATYFAKSPVKNQTAIIIIGGGQWGNYWGEQFANKGFVGLSLPYTGNEGLPKLPEEIPLEYFESAINWLAKQPEVNPDNILLMGASRNSELALVLASNFPELLSGVIAYSPSSVSWSNTVLSYNSDKLKPSWTYKGADIPYVPMEKIIEGNSSILNTLAYWENGLKQSDDVSRAGIKVERIKGPILLLSGKDDKVWPSSFMANMIEKRLKENGFGYDIENIQFEEAGHLISRNPESDSDTSVRTGEMKLNGKTYTFEFGGTQGGDNQAKKQAKAKVFEFLERLD